MTPPLFIDPRSAASNPGGIAVDDTLIARILPEAAGAGLLSKGRFQASQLRAHVKKGDTRAAVVLQTNPSTLVACYSDDFDASVVLAYGPEAAQGLGLVPGSRLLTVNIFTQGVRPVSDIVPGPNPANRSFSNFTPVIADFICSDVDVLLWHRSRISEQEWQRCAQAGVEYLQRTGGVARSGLYPASGKPVKTARS